MFTPETLLDSARQAIKAWRDEYDAEVRDWYENGDGRAVAYIEDLATGRTENVGGKGHRFPRCIHGASLWVDHDIPCGACEFDESTDEEKAQEMAERISREVNERSTYLSYRPSGMPSDLTTALIDWAFEPLKALQPRS